MLVPDRTLVTAGVAACERNVLGSAHADTAIHHLLQLIDASLEL